MGTITYSGELVVWSCWCGLRYAIPDELAREHKHDKDSVLYCPLGHRGVARVHDRREAARLREQLQWEQDQRRAAEADAEHQRAVARGYKGAMAQSKKRAAKGVCPVPGCRRHFVDVQRHVESKHPDWTAEG